MEKQIITFSANEQKLIKTGGIECYASNIVSYIEAHFDLGANWSGYDSVRAVWSNDNNMTVISTVLDSNGVCVVPFEVLKTKGVVMVNLVGSISVSNVLTDRLTTFPCEAVKVTAKAKIEGSETAQITPSQFEQFVAAVVSEVEKVTGMTAQAETLPAGSQATARYEDGILYLGIPQGIQGERGETGADGNGIVSVVYNADYTLTLVFTNGERFTTPPIRGERGPAGQDGRDGTNGRDGADGVTPSLSIGTVETLEPTQDAYVTRRGTDDNPIFDFGIPKGDTGEVTMSQLSALLPTDTASGSIASFSDGTDLVPAISVKAQIEPIQDLHGYDKPWSGGAGANKFLPFPSTQTQNGITLTCDNGVLTINGTATADTWFDINTSLQIASGTAFYFFAFNPSASVTRLSLFAVGNSGNPQVNLNNANASFSSTATSDNTITKFRLRVPNGEAYSNFKLSPYFQVGGTAPTQWTPYSNICPISGHTECVTSVSPTTSASDGTTHTTSLGRTVYGGTLDVVSGELTDKMVLIDLGSLNWVSEDSVVQGQFRAVYAGNPIFQSNVPDYYGSAVCSAYPFGGIKAWDELNNKSVAFSNGEGIAFILRLKDTTYAGMSADAFKSAMSGVQLCYELATPQTYQLDPQTIDLLLGQNNLWTDCGSVEVTYKADVGLYIDKKLGTGGTRSLSMGLTKSATAEAETETKTVEAETEEVKAEPSKTETDKTETETR